MTRFFIFGIGCYLLVSLPAGAQQSKDSTHISHTSLSLPPQLFSFVLITGAVQKASHRNTEGDYHVKSTVQPCWEGGIDYQHSIGKAFSYVLGAHLIVSGRSTVFDLPALQSNPSVHYEQNPQAKDQPFDLGLAVPLLIENQWPLTEHKALYVSAGVQFNLALNRDFDELFIVLSDSNNNPVQVFHQLAYTFNNNKPWLNCKLGSGIQWVLKNENLLGIGLTATLSFTNFVRGMYEVTIPGFPDTKGIYTATGSYLGIHVSYGLSGKFRRKIKGSKL